MGQRSSVWRVAALIVTAIALVGCVTTPIVVPLNYRSHVTSELNYADIEGRQYSNWVIPDGTDLPGKQDELAVVMEELERRLAERNFHRAPDWESADFIIGIHAGYSEATVVNRNAVYSGGDLETVRIERHIPEYNQHGQIRRTRVEYDTELRRTPRVQTGVREVLQDVLRPVIMLSMQRAEDYISGGQNAPTMVSRKASIELDMDDDVFSFVALTVASTRDVTLEETGACLVNVLTRYFPAAHQAADHHQPDRWDCVIRPPTPEGSEPATNSPAPAS